MLHQGSAVHLRNRHHVITDLFEYSLYSSVCESLYVGSNQKVACQPFVRLLKKKPFYSSQGVSCAIISSNIKWKELPLRDLNNWYIFAVSSAVISFILMAAYISWAPFYCSFFFSRHIVRMKK